MIVLEKDTDDTPFCQITSPLSHICVCKSGRGVCASNIEDSESYAFFAFFFPGHSILLMGFRILLCLQAAKHSSSNEANSKCTKLNIPKLQFSACLGGKLPFSECTDHKTQEPFCDQLKLPTETPPASSPPGTQDMLIPWLLLTPLVKPFLSGPCPSSVFQFHS